MTKTVIFVLEIELDEKIVKTTLVYGKYDKAMLVDNNLLNSFQFLTLKLQVYTEPIPKDYGSLSIKLKNDFGGIQWSTLLNLRSFPVFGMTRAVIHFTKLLVNRLHG